MKVIHLGQHLPLINLTLGLSITYVNLVPLVFCKELQRTVFN